VLRRFAEYHDLEGAFGRRAITERAKGILMERHSVDDADAFEMLRDQSRRTNTKLADVAAAVVDGHRLLPKQPDVSQTARLFAPLVALLSQAIVDADQTPLALANTVG
jgi:hypothetical protein